MGEATSPPQTKQNIESAAMEDQNQESESDAGDDDSDESGDEGKSAASDNESGGEEERIESKVEEPPASKGVAAASIEVAASVATSEGAAKIPLKPSSVEVAAKNTVSREAPPPSGQPQIGGSESKAPKNESMALGMSDDDDDDDFPDIVDAAPDAL